MTEPRPLPCGIYERLVDEELRALLDQHPELKPIFEGIDDESSPHTYSQFLWQLLRTALPVAKPEQRLGIVNRLVGLLAAQDGLDYTRRRILMDCRKPMLREIRHAGQAHRLPRPETPMAVSSLLTGAAGDPQLERELRAEMMTADRVDILVSFIKWAGLRLLRPAFEDLVDRRIPVRIITTSYMGASDPEAVEWLASQPGFSVKVSYDTERTRLHAKAYHFTRATGYSTTERRSCNKPGTVSGRCCATRTSASYSSTEWCRCTGSMYSHRFRASQIMLHGPDWVRATTTT